MPGGDRTGPTGHGPLTGRGAGYCGGRDAPDSWEAPRGRGFLSDRGGRRRRGRGMGSGGGWGRGAGRGPGFGRGRRGGGGGGDPELAPEAEGDAEQLRAESRRLRAQMKSVEKRLEELKESE